MKYFRYVQALDRFLALRIYNVVSDLEFFARKKYKGLYQDALDATMEHVLKHYNPESNNLEHYTMAVLSKILLSVNAKEVSSEDVLEIESSKQSYKESLEQGSEYYNMEDIEEVGSLEDCIDYLLPFFLKDFEMFKNRKVGTRKLKYPGLFQLYTPEIVSKAMSVLVEEGYDKAVYLSDLSATTNYRCFPDTRYLASMDKTLEYVGTVNGIVLCKFVNSKRKKYVYHVDIGSFVDSIVDLFYIQGDESKAARSFFDKMVYVTLSGREVIGEDNLRAMLENEIVGSLLARKQRVKVLNYNRGKDMLIASTNEDEQSIIFPIFGMDITLDLQRVVFKRV